MGGGGHGHADAGHGHGAGDFRNKVWSMTGGPYCRPVHWRRNTAIALFGIVLVCIPIAMKSAELEVLIVLFLDFIFLFILADLFWLRSIWTRFCLLSLDFLGGKGKTSA